MVRVVAKQKLKYLSSEFNREISALLMSRDSVALMRNSVALTEGVQGTHLNPPVSTALEGSPTVKFGNMKF